MNHQRIYDEIISDAKSRGLNKKLLEGYFEKHHIVPICMNGTNDKSNLVLLTAREHYLCHWLLWKIHKDNFALFRAYHKMSFSKNSFQERDYKISSKQYEILRLEHIRICKTKIVSEETKRKMSESHKGVSLSKEHIEKIVNGFTNSPKYYDAMKSEERSKKISESKLGKPSLNKGFKWTEEQKEKLRGREFTEEHCKNISIACKGRKAWNDGIKVGPLSDEQKFKISMKMKGRIVSDETKLKLRNAAIAREERKRNLLKLDLQN